MTPVEERDELFKISVQLEDLLTEIAVLIDNANNKIEEAKQQKETE